MRDYGGDISCPMCGHPHHISPRQLQADFEIVFTCGRCGMDVVHENTVAWEIAQHFETIKFGLSRMRIY
jgi:transcription elongation factor Elf1